MVFNQSGTVFDPITCVAVHQSVNIELLRSVDMTADHTVTSSESRMLHDMIPKAADVTSHETESVLSPGHK